MQSDYLRGLLDYQYDDIEVTRIDSDILKFILLFIKINKTAEKEKVKEKVAETYNFLGFDDKFDFIQEFYCNWSNCKGISLTKSYCPTHKCVIENCLHPTNDKSKYCYNHKCQIDRCIHSHEDNSYFCKWHKCAVFEYNKAHGQEVSSLSQYCNNHICQIQKEFNCLVYCDNVKYSGSYCIEHKCSVSDCKSHKVCNGFNLGFRKYCAHHRCWIDDCDNIAIKGHYCEFHRGSSRC